MSNNRTEQQAIWDGLAPIVDIDEVQAAGDTAGYVFKKDVGVTVIAAAGAAIANFSGNDQVSIDASAEAGNTAITITGLEDGQEAHLYVTKGLTKTVSFVGINGTIDGQRIGQGTLVYKLISINGFIIAIQISGRQNAGSILEVNLSVSTGTIIDFKYFDYQTNDNIIKFEGSLTWKVSAATSVAFDLNVASWPIELKRLAAYMSGTASFELPGLSAEPLAMKFLNDAGALSINFGRSRNTTWVLNDEVEIYFSAQAVIL